MDFRLLHPDEIVETWNPPKAGRTGGSNIEGEIVVIQTPRCRTPAGTNPTSTHVELDLDLKQDLHVAFKAFIIEMETAMARHITDKSEEWFGQPSILKDAVVSSKIVEEGAIFKTPGRKVAVFDENEVEMPHGADALAEVACVMHLTGAWMYKNMVGLSLKVVCMKQYGSMQDTMFRDVEEIDSN
jgi:hypothetical protein